MSRPRVILHGSVSLDGRIDGFMPDIGLFYELAQTWQEGASLAGTDTLLAAAGEGEEEAAEPVAPPGSDDRRPLLVVPDSRGRFQRWREMLAASFWRAGLALCTEVTPQEHLDYLDRAGIERLTVGEDRVDLAAALEHLATQRGVQTVRVDSGGTLNGALLRAGLVDEVSVLINPCLVGGLSPRSMFRAPDLTPDEAAIPLRLIHLEQIRDDIVWLRCEVKRGD
ncbi:RibD family protein [Candidatus Sumerlaeota bacterium]|nr:RibD family protein [Candidatus Sumerlaeota bacterium]